MPWFIWALDVGSEPLRAFFTVQYGKGIMLNHTISNQILQYGFLSLSLLIQEFQPHFAVSLFLFAVRGLCRRPARKLAPCGGRRQRLPDV